MDQSHGHKTNYYDYIFKNSIKSDVTLMVKDKIIRAHKLVLGPQNPVFMEQFMSQPELTKYEILDVDSTAFQIFIDYLYTGNLFDENVNEDLLLVAHKYANPTLINICRDKLRKTINSGDVINKLLIFIKCDEKFAEETSTLVAKNFNDLKTRPNFKLVLENTKAMDAILNVFDKDVAVLTQDQTPNQETLIDSALRSDLTIKVQDVHFLVHKEILSRRNTILKTIVSSLTTASNLCPSIDVPDLDPKSFKSFLKYIYTGDIDEKDISEELMRVAHRYEDKKLMKICEDNLLSSVCEDNVAELLILATKVESEKMKEKTSKFIADRYVEMKQRVDFQQVKQCPEAFEAVFNQFAAKIDNTNAFKGTISMKVPCTEGRTSSEQFYVGNIPWNMVVSLKKNNTAYVGFFLYCLDKNVPFEHKVNYGFKLISSVDKSHDVVHGPSTRTFTSNAGSNNWGVPCFLRFDDLNDKEKGLVMNGTVKIEVQVKFVD